MVSYESNALGKGKNWVYAVERLISIWLLLHTTKLLYLAESEIWNHVVIKTV